MFRMILGYLLCGWYSRLILSGHNLDLGVIMESGLGLGLIPEELL